jgi:putative flippase GtrA
MTVEPRTPQDRLDKVRRVDGIRLTPKFARYGIASIVTTIFTLILLGVLEFNLTPGLANLLAVGIGSVISFELNRRWVWRQAQGRLRWRQPLTFAAISLLFLGLSTLAVRTVASGLPAHRGSLVRATVIEITTVAVFSVRWVTQYVLFDRILFPEVKSPL